LLKIAIVTNNYKPYSGGLVSSIDSFSNELRTAGHKVIIVTLDFLGNNNGNEKDIFRIRCHVRFNYKNNPIAIPFNADNELLGILKDFSPDIIHSQHPFLLGISALKASKKLQIPIVFTYHTQYDKYLHYIPLPYKISEPIVKNLALNYCRKIDGIIVPSQSINNFLNEHSVNKNIQVIPSGILPVFLPQDFKIKEKKKVFHLLTVSRFRKEKNIEFLLEAFSKLDQNKFKFTLIGYGSDLEHLKNYAYQKLNLAESNVQFIEKPEKEIILSYYKSADVFIFSSVTETQGIVLAEAMANGTPVIAFDAPGSNDIIKNGFNGFLVNSLQEMIERILLIAENRRLNELLQFNAYKTGQEYSSEKTTAKLVNFYKLFIRK